METRANTKRVGIVALATVFATVAIPVASASGTSSDPGLVARKLGSPDPREHVTKVQYASGIVAGRLGSPDPRETALATTAPSAVASTLGSPDPGEAVRDQEMRNEPINLRRMGGVSGSAGLEGDRSTKGSRSSAVATTLGSPDPRDTALVEGESLIVSDTFDWADFGIGIGFGIGLAAILAGTVVLGLVFRGGGRSVAHPLG